MTAKSHRLRPRQKGGDSECDGIRVTYEDGVWLWVLVCRTVEDEGVLRRTWKEDEVNRACFDVYEKILFWGEG